MNLWKDKTKQKKIKKEIINEKHSQRKQKEKERVDPCDK